MTEDPKTDLLRVVRCTKYLLAIYAAYPLILYGIVKKINPDYSPTFMQWAGVVALAVVARYILRTDDDKL